MNLLLYPLTVEDEIREYQESCKTNYQMLNERPKGMSFEAYRILLAMQKRGVKKYIKGQQIFVAKNSKLPKEKGVSYVKKK